MTENTETAPATRAIYVVNWTVPEGGVGGFEWRSDAAEAETVHFELNDPTATIHIVEVPAALDGWQISELLDAEGWSDGGDPRGTEEAAAMGRHGRCDTCGAPCNAEGCVIEIGHDASQD